MISSYRHKYKDNFFKKKKKKMHVTKNLHSMLTYFILRNAIAHCYKKIVMKSLNKAKLLQKKKIYQDFNLAETKSMHRKWCYVWMVMLLLIQVDWVQSAANLVVSILSISSQIKWNYSDMNKEHM